MAIQDDNTVLCKGDLKAYHEKILPYLGGNFMLDTNVSDYYSTDEKIVGVWTDGKPLYQKTFISTMVTNGGNITQVDSTGTFEYKDIKSVLCYDAKTIQESTCFHSTSNYWTIWIENHYAKGKAADASYGGKTVYITIKYTKTTDAANSAVTTPGCYDINRPDLWPANQEIFFGNGLYGYRAIGNYTTAMPAGATDWITVVDRNIGFTTNYPTYAWGGNLQVYSNDASAINNQPLNSRRGVNFFSCAYIANAGNLRIMANSVSGGSLRIRTQDKYDVWFTYTK